MPNTSAFLKRRAFCMRKRVKYVTAHAQKFSDVTICILVQWYVHVFHLSKLFFGNLSNGVRITMDALYLQNHLQKQTTSGFSLKRGTAAPCRSVKPANKVGAVNYVKMYRVYDRTTVCFSHVFTIIANVVLRRTTRAA